MKTKVLLAMCAVLLTGTGFAALTADPNILNPDFENGTETGDNFYQVVPDWYEAGGNSNRVRVQKEGVNNARFTPYGTYMLKCNNTGDAAYQAVSTFLPNTPYEITVWLGSRNDQDGGVYQFELWAGGNPALVTGDDDVYTRNDPEFPLAVAGATLIDGVAFDYSDSSGNRGDHTFPLVTGTTHTTSDVLWLVISDQGGGQSLFDNVVMTISPNTAQLLPENGATGLPVSTDADPDDPTNTTLEWVGPGTYTGETFDVYIGTTEPNFLVGAPYDLTAVATGTTATSADPSPSSDLAFETTYYWVVDTYEPNAPDPDIYHPATTYSSFTTRPSDVAPVVTFTQSFARTWIGEPVALDATVVDSDAEVITSVEWVVTPPASWAAYLGDPNDVVTNKAGTNNAPTADFVVNIPDDPNALGTYQIDLFATDDDSAASAPPFVALTGSDRVGIQVNATPCDMFKADGRFIRPEDINTDCVVDLVDFARVAEDWLDNRIPDAPYIFTN